MTPRRLLIFACALVLIACGRGGDPVAAPSAPDVPAGLTAQLRTDLRDGGYVLLFRHAATDRDKPELDPTDYSRCAVQRLLSDEGKAQARRIGEAVDRAGVPVGEVRSSPFCRARATARLAFGAAEPDPDLLYLVAADDDAHRRRLVEALRAKLALRPPAGANTVLVSHTDNIELATGLVVDEGEAVVVRPHGDGFTALAIVASDQWRPTASP